MTENTKKFLMICLSVIVIALFVAILMHAYIGSFSRFLADDYCTSGELKNSGFWPSQKYWYTHWTGRYSFIFTVTAFESLGTKIVPFLSSIYIAGFILSGVFFMGNLLKKLIGKTPYLVAVFLTAVIVFMTLYTAPNIGQNLYWLTGSANYFVPLITIPVLFGLLLQQQQRYLTHPAAVKILLGFFIAVLSWVTSGFSEIITVIQFLVLLIVNVYFRFFHQAKRFSSLWGIAFFACTMGLLMMIASPGNAMRISVHHVDRYNIFFLLTNTIRYTGSFSILWFLKQAHLIWPISILIIVVTVMMKKFFFLSLGDEIVKSNTRVLISFLIFIFLVFASFLPTTWATGNAPEERVLIYPSFLLSIFVVYVSALAGLYLCQGISPYKADGKILAFILVVFTLYFAVSVPVYEGRKVYYTRSEAMKFAELWDQREIDIREKIQAGQKQLVVRMIPSNIMAIEHLQSDPNHWINICAAKYYGVESIYAE